MKDKDWILLMSVRSESIDKGSGVQSVYGKIRTGLVTGRCTASGKGEE